jgi:hypothetical protein
MEATTIRDSTSTRWRSRPTSPYRIHASITMPLSSTRSRTSNLVRLDASSTPTAIGNPSPHSHREYLALSPANLVPWWLYRSSAVRPGFRTCFVLRVLKDGWQLGCKRGASRSQQRSRRSPLVRRDVQSATRVSQYGEPCTVSDNVRYGTIRDAFTGISDSATAHARPGGQSGATGPFIFPIRPDPQGTVLCSTQYTVFQIDLPGYPYCVVRKHKVITRMLSLPLLTPF